MYTRPERREQVAAFYAAHATRLRRAVAWHARTSHEVLDDACASAWTLLVRRPDITLDARGFSWLTTVAIREARQLATRYNHELPVGSFQASSGGHDDEDVPEPVDPLAPDTETQALDRLQHAADLQALTTLTPDERVALYLKALGYSYHEICQLTDSTYTAVNRRITEGRRAIRRPATHPSNKPAGEPPDKGAKTRPRALTALMTPTTYQGHAIAIADVDGFHLATHVDRLPDGHPLKTFVCFLALYAVVRVAGRVRARSSSTAPGVSEDHP